MDQHFDYGAAFYNAFGDDQGRLLWRTRGHDFEWSLIGRVPQEDGQSSATVEMDFDLIMQAHIMHDTFSSRERKTRRVHMKPLLDLTLDIEDDHLTTHGSGARGVSMEILMNGIRKHRYVVHNGGDVMASAWKPLDPDHPAFLGTFTPPEHLDPNKAIAVQRLAQLVLRNATTLSHNLPPEKRPRRSPA